MYVVYYVKISGFLKKKRVQLLACSMQDITRGVILVDIIRIILVLFLYSFSRTHLWVHVALIEGEDLKDFSV